jgi:hypothetical protein
VPFLDVLLTGDRGLVLSFIERGADPLADHPFARAFHQLRAKTTIGSYRIAGASGLTSRRACSGRRTWPCDSSPRTEI